MPKPLRRIGASKLATVSEYPSSHARPSQSLPLTIPAASQQPLPAHVIARPATGIVLTIASGQRAGEMIGTDDHEVMIGFTHDCLLRFASDPLPPARSKLLLRRGSKGWYVLRVSGNSAFINQHLLKHTFPLRSGDIIRLSSRGPDVQFTMQSGGLAIRALVDRYLPQQASVSPEPVASAKGDVRQLTPALAAEQPADATVDVSVAPAGPAPAMGLAADAAVDAAADAEPHDVVASSPAAIAPGSLWIGLPSSKLLTKLTIALLAAILAIILSFLWFT